MYTVRPPYLLKAFYHDLEWRIPVPGRSLFLTFDDGPIPEVTPQVLDMLDAFGAKATFFCIGDNVRKHPEIYRDILQRGHAVGNHTQHHLNGWKVPDRRYYRNVLQCAEWVQSDLFRPPYGRITPTQAKVLGRRFRIIMWDVLSGDFDTSLSPASCLRRVTAKARPGSVIVFHDSIKAAPRMLSVLPEALSRWTNQGYDFLPIR